MRPTLSYTIWFSQRTGSTLLCKALESTGLAGKPNEWLLEYDTFDLFRKYGVQSPEELQSILWKQGMTPNGVFGLKVSVSEPHNGKMIETFRKFPGCAGGISRPDVWENAFPNHKHLWMTRRDKIRLAVSWWKAIKSNEWHRRHGENPSVTDVRGEYVYDAICHLFNEAALREVLAEKFFAEGNIVPFTIVYEDFIRDYTGTVRKILEWMGVATQNISFEAPYFDRLADDINDEWAERFEKERTERLGT